MRKHPETPLEQVVALATCGKAYARVSLRVQDGDPTVVGCMNPGSIGFCPDCVIFKAPGKVIDTRSRDPAVANSPVPEASA